MFLLLFAFLGKPKTVKNQHLLLGDSPNPQKQAKKPSFWQFCVLLGKPEMVQIMKNWPFGDFPSPQSKPKSLNFGNFGRPWGSLNWPSGDCTNPQTWPRSNNFGHFPSPWGSQKLPQIKKKSFGNFPHPQE